MAVDLAQLKGRRLRAQAQLQVEIDAEVDISVYLGQRLIDVKVGDDLVEPVQHARHVEIAKAPGVEDGERGSPS